MLLSEHLFFDCQDETSLMADLGFLAHLPEMCDVTFMVGPEKVNILVWINHEII